MYRKWGGCVDNFESYIQDLKASVDLVEVVGQDEPLTQRGRVWRGVRHDSLVVTPERGLWFWNSRHIGGDVLTWCLEIRGWDFKRAVEELARRYGMEPPDWQREDSQARLAAQKQADVLTIVARYFVGTLRNSPDARSYCSLRGWLDATVQMAGLGFWDGDKKALRDHLKMHEVDLGGNVARALLSAPANMLVYPHLEFGRVVYITYRGISEKKHHNLPSDLVGDRRPLWNHAAQMQRGPIVVVEGQTDAITLAQWDIPAVALCGVAIGETGQGSRLAAQLAKHEPVFWGTDSDDAGAMSVKKGAYVLGPMVRVIRWPDHDANDWLKNDPEHATEEAAKALLENAPIYALVLAEQIGQMADYAKPEGLKRLMEMVARMDDHEQSVYRRSIAKAANVSVKIFDKLLSVAMGDTGEDDEDEDVHIPYPTIGGMVDGCLLETLYIAPDNQPANAVLLQGGQTLFAVRDAEGGISTKPYFDSGTLRFQPINADTPFIREGVVIFPAKIGDKLPPAELIKRIRALIHKYVDVDEFYEALSAYYVLFSWCYDAFPTLSYLRLKGDAGTGKTRFLEVVGSLCYRPTLMNAGASTASMFRLMDVVRGTLVMDEGDFSSTDERSDINKMLTVGNQRRQAHISRAGSKETNFTPEFFNVYGPKMISTRKDFDDNAIESRCLTKETGAPTSRDDIPRNLPDTFWTVEILELQALLLRFRLENWSPDLNARQVPIDTSVEPRLQQVTDSLKKMIGDPSMLNELERFIQHYNNQLISNRGLETEAKLLEAIMILHEEQVGIPPDKRNYSLTDVANMANDLMDYDNDTPIEEWSRYKRKGRDKRISPKGAGHMLRSKLNLQTHRPGHGSGRRYHVLFDETRVSGLWRRFGLGTQEARDLLMQSWKTIKEMTAQEDMRRANMHLNY